jgi:hypothetical protein
MKIGATKFPNFPRPAASIVKGTALARRYLRCEEPIRAVAVINGSNMRV